MVTEKQHQYVRPWSNKCEMVSSKGVQTLSKCILYYCAYLTKFKSIVRRYKLQTNNIFSVLGVIFTYKINKEPVSSMVIVFTAYL